MIAQDGTWGDLAPGGYMRDRNGKTWKIAGISRDGRVGIEDRAGERHILEKRAAATPVTLMVLDDDEQMKLLVDELGAELYAERERSAAHGHPADGGVWACPRFPATGEEAANERARTHLRWVHRIYTEPSSRMPALVKAHDQSHERMAELATQEPRLRGNSTDPIPHVHRTDDRWYEKLIPATLTLP